VTVEAVGGRGGAPVRSSPRSRLTIGRSWSWPPSARRRVDVCPPWWSGAGTGLACGAAPGDPEPRTRTGRLPAGRAATWPPPTSRALRKLRVPAGPPTAALDPADCQAARRDPVARGGRGAAPDQQAGGEDRGGPGRDPHPAGTC
jgi:hypothetical protein